MNSTPPSVMEMFSSCKGNDLISLRQSFFNPGEQMAKKLCFLPVILLFILFSRGVFFMAFYTPFQYPCKVKVLYKSGVAHNTFRQDCTDKTVSFKAHNCHKACHMAIIGLQSVKKSYKKFTNFIRKSL